jgi:RNA polymerase sigma factor (sigma-70 family)
MRAAWIAARYSRKRTLPMPDLHAEQLRRYRAAFDNLPWVQREIFRLHAVEDYSYAEIAFLLRTNVRTVERQMAKAIYKIAKQVDGHGLSWWERWF